MKKLKNNIGMTLAEMLIVVAIIGVLGGVAFVSVWNYQRSMGQLERDGIAKEIFVAAQNHLTAAYGEGYLGLKEPASGSSDTNPFGTKADDGSYYFVVNGTGDAANATVFDQILPFGSVDETVRGGGSYIIH
jgi:prepilin-type N-terminal cleavage/methylation domain